MKRAATALMALICALALCVPALAAVGSASTRIYDSSNGYLNNVDLAIAMLDGTEVWPDDSFSFNDALGPRTAADGYQKAEDGRGAMIYGGGVDQVAATLYLAIEERGDVDYIERKVYGSKFTGDYVDSGNEAIVTDYDRDVDFSFLNYGDSFTIRLSRSGKTITCTLEDDGSYNWDDEDDEDWYEDYIFPDSDRVKLTRDDIYSIPRSLWAYARNEIYARHGYSFKIKKYRDYFSEKDWYVPGGFSTQNLNATEWYNMDLIKAMEKGSGGSSSSSSSFDDYIFPHSSTRKLTRREIEAIPESEWGYARNEIWARHGYEFKTKKYRDYFNEKSWYEPGGYSEKDVNKTEWYNMELIKSLEDEYGVN